MDTTLHPKRTRVWARTAVIGLAPLWIPLAPLADLLYLPIDLVIHREATCPCMNACLESLNKVFETRM